MKMNVVCDRFSSYLRQIMVGIVITLPLQSYNTSSLASAINSWVYRVQFGQDTSINPSKV